MSTKIILASGSAIRAQMLSNAQVPYQVQVARIDEDAVMQSLIAEQTRPRDIADTLAEIKAQKISSKNPGALVIGADQVLDIDGDILQKPGDIQEASRHLNRLNGKTHRLLSAACVFQDGQPHWRHVGTVRLTMRQCSAEYLDDYLERNWDSIRHAVGCYKLEEEGVRLFSTIQGDYFTVLGLPLVELLGYLTAKGVLSG